MAVGLVYPSNLLPVQGIRIGAVDAGIRKSPGEDLVIFSVCRDAAIAGVFTQNKACAAPVSVCRKNLFDADAARPGKLRALVANSGNANAGVGDDGMNDCLQICDSLAESIGISRTSVLPFSTGVIGERLPLEKFIENIPNCLEIQREDNWLSAARAIMTTDTVPKAVSKSVDLGAKGSITISGIAKGSGMIQPNMATMLAFVATDAQIETPILQEILNKSADKSFNRITVDGDTSTNDSCILVATGQSGVTIEDSDTDDGVRQLFETALLDVMQHLAQAIVRDGEGATKFVEIEVIDGSNEQDCVLVATTVSNSLLVKTALHASDPNWGRIYAAIGRSGIHNLDVNTIGLKINDAEVMKNGTVSKNYNEDLVAEIMEEDEFCISIDLGTGGKCSAKVWTCDLSYEYVRINAEYRS